MGWSQAVNNDFYNDSSTTTFGWTQSEVYYSSSSKKPGLNLNKYVFKTIDAAQHKYVEPHKLYKPIGLYFTGTASKIFKSHKTYQFNVKVSNYLQVGENKNNYFSPPLYMVTPLGSSEFLSGAINDQYSENVDPNSDTCYFPWPFFESNNSVSLLDNSPYSGRIFTLHYYSSSPTDVTSHFSQHPTIFYSNVFFGNASSDLPYYLTPNSLLDNQYFNYWDLPFNAVIHNGLLIKPNGSSNKGSESIMNVSINESDWLVQGYSYASLYLESGGVPLLIPKPWSEGGTLFGNGWYVYPKNTYIWYDRPKSTQNMWQSGYPYRVPQYDSDSQFRNMPVGGPWIEGIDIDIPCHGDYYTIDSNSPSLYNPISPNKHSNQGSILNGTVKTPHEGFRTNNYIARYVNMDKFNLSFNYQNSRGDNTGVKIFLSQTLPSQNPLNITHIDSSGGPIPIGDLGTTLNTILINSSSVPNMIKSPLKEIRIKLDIDHTWDGDLIINLKGPSGGVINLFNRERGNSDNFKNTVFSSDDTKPSIYYSNAPFSGVYKMKKDINVGYTYNSNSYKSNVKDIKNLLNGTDITGSWTLYIKDDASLDVGRLNNWSIDFIYDSTSNVNYVGVLTQSTATQSYNFLNLQGNQYVIFVADKISVNTPSSTYSIVTIGDLNIQGSYHSLNNTLFNEWPSPTQSNMAFSTIIGDGNNLNATQSFTYSYLTSKAGSGRFSSGIWEDGNWINGWRDADIYSFFDVYQFYSYNNNKKWRFSIVGPSYYVSKFSVGDKVSISNVVVIDINEERRLIKNYFTVITTTSNTLVVEFNYDFPIRRIEKDSPYHKINVTKNIWLNGNFFNGRFKGNWIDGQVYGYPFITKIEDTHWTDGKFRGGQFSSKPISLTFSSSSLSSNVSAKIPLLEINLGVTHSFAVNDKIYVSEYLDDTQSVLFGDTTITNITNPTSVVTNIVLNQSIYSSIGNGFIGKVVSDNKTGLIQHIDLDSINVSSVTSANTLDDRTVFSYNSWLDLVYDQTSATNIFKPQTILDSYMNVYYSQNNLYGWTTTDVLSSSSKFRDSFSTSVRQYKLGTKWKIFHDYIGDSGLFESDFAPNSQTFKDLGWTWTKSNLASPPFSPSAITFSRTIETTDDLSLTGKELKVTALEEGGVLNLQSPLNEVPNRYDEKIKPNRYTMVSFDLTSYNSYNQYFTDIGNTITNGFVINDIQEPVLHFGNLNLISRRLFEPSHGYVMDIKIEPTYLPIYKNINHIITPNKTKVEYFYNKRDLLMYFRGSGDGGQYQSEFNIDNLKLYEVDMIPFFQYFTYENINRTVQKPIEIKRSEDIKTNDVYEYVNKSYSGIDLYEKSKEIPNPNIAAVNDQIFNSNNNSV